MDKIRLRRWIIGDFSWRRLAISTSVIYVVFAAFAWFYSERLMFHPDASVHRQTRDRVLFPAVDGSLVSAAYLPVDGARYTLLFSHGNGEDVGDLTSLFTRLNALGFAVFAWDYRGYGASEGVPTEAASYRDIDAAYAYLTETLGVAPESVIAYGRSLGGGPATDLATRAPLAGLILESTFVTIFRIRTVIPLLPFDRFRNIDKIAGVRCPVLVMHGTADGLIPLWHGEALFDRAPAPKLAAWMDGVSHAGVPFDDEAGYADALLRFVALLEG